MEHQIITAWAGVGIGVGQLIMIGWGLRQMGKASEERTLQLDIMREESRGQLDIMREESRGQTKVLADIGQADIGHTRPGDGVSRYRPGDTRPGDTMVLADIGQGIRDQGMVLAKLLQQTP